MDGLHLSPVSYKDAALTNRSCAEKLWFSKPRYITLLVSMCAARWTECAGGETVGTLLAPAHTVDSGRKAEHWFLEPGRLYCRDVWDAIAHNYTGIDMKKIRQSPTGRKKSGLTLLKPVGLWFESSELNLHLIIYLVQMPKCFMIVRRFCVVL